jgi:hypothetical protein
MPARTYELEVTVAEQVAGTSAREAEIAELEAKAADRRAATARARGLAKQEAPARRGPA